MMSYLPQQPATKRVRSKCHKHTLSRLWIVKTRLRIKNCARFVTAHLKKSYYIVLTKSVHNRTY